MQGLGGFQRRSAAEMAPSAPVGAGVGMGPAPGVPEGPPPPPSGPPQAAAPPVRPQGQQAAQPPPQGGRSLPELVDMVMSKQLPSAPSLQTVTGTIDVIARRLPWYVWLVIGLFGMRFVPKLGSWIPSWLRS